MRVPLSWLREFVDFAIPADQLAEVLTNAGLEVSGVEQVGGAGAELVWDRQLVVFGEIISVAPHPNADRLVVATVDYGAGRSRQVVTGAPNLRPFLETPKLPHRHFGALLLEGGEYLDVHKPDDRGPGKKSKLKGKELRGVYNDAMLCSAAELGLGDDHDGILLWREGDFLAMPQVGTALVEVLGDTVLELEIIPNVSRCASVFGVAREVAALLDLPLRTPGAEVLAEGPPLEGRMRVEIEDAEHNPRFVAMLVEGVEPRPSPFWMQHRLSLCGQRPIHAVVDVSNYVMLELGQPNHTFDYDVLCRRAGSAGQDIATIRTRLAHSGERLLTLDGKEHVLSEGMILVTDGAGVLSLGGVMGGRDSEITLHTSNVLVEAAAWRFTDIRRTQRLLGVNTEAGFRFSRGVHPSQALLGARRVAELLRIHAGGRVAQGLIDEYPGSATPVVLFLDPAWVNSRTGLELTSSEVARLLQRLQFEVVENADGILRVTAPDFRLDIEGTHDLVEEVCRVYGYDRVPSTVIRDVLPPQRANSQYEAEERLRDAMVDLGFQEVISYRLTTEEAEARTRADHGVDGPYVRLKNPSTRERVVMRHSMLSSVLEAAVNNSRFCERMLLFELGSVYPLSPGSFLPDERPELSLIMTGRRDSPHFAQAAPAMFDFYDAKGVVEALLSILRVEVVFRGAEHASLRPGRTAEVLAGDGASLGHVGELHPAVVARSDLRIPDEQPVLAALLDAGEITRRSLLTFEVEPVPVYPAIREDLALVVDEGVPAGRVNEALWQAGAPLLRHVELFDIYRGPSLTSGKKSLAYHLAFQSPKRTLKDKEVERLRSKILADLQRALGATLR